MAWRFSFFTRCLWTFYDFREAGRKGRTACYFAGVICVAWPRTKRTAAISLGFVAAVGLGGCSTTLDTRLERQLDATKLAADVLVQFTKAGDAANRAVMAETDETSVAFAREAEQSTQAVVKDSAALRPLLTALQYSNELSLLDEFDMRFAAYRALDRSVLDLAVENTNLKAQRLSFGPAREAADAVRTSLEAVMPASQADVWHVKALIATAVAAVRDIQAWQAPHIAESDDAAMTEIEKRMMAAERTARDQMTMLAGLITAGSRTQLAAASASLDRFMGLNAQLTALSRRNTNVRSLALSLGQKRMLTATCEDSLRALQDALSKRGFSATR